MQMPSAWDPFFVTDQIAIEKVQKCATKMVPTIKYNEHFKLYYYRRKRGDNVPNAS